MESALVDADTEHWSRCFIAGPGAWDVTFHVRGGQEKAGCVRVHTLMRSAAIEYALCQAVSKLEGAEYEVTATPVEEEDF